MSDYDRMTRAELLERGGEALAGLAMPHLRGVVRAMEELPAQERRRADLRRRVGILAARADLAQLEAAVASLERGGGSGASRPAGEPVLRLVGEEEPEPPPEPAA